MSAQAEKFAEQFDVSRETLNALSVFASLVKKWSPKINLIAPGTLPQIWSRHISDSAQLLSLAPETAQTWVDLGSGGGFPGLIIAVMRPDLQVTLVESDQRKATFLRTASRETGAGAKVISKRIEQLEPMEADVVSARALASLEKLIEFAELHAAPDGTAIFPKGARHKTELAEAQKTWSFTYSSHPSLTDPEAAILKIGEIARV